MVRPTPTPPAESRPLAATSSKGLNDAFEVELHAEVRERLPVGVATAIFVAGACFHPAGIEALEIVVGSARHTPDTWGRMPARAPAARSGFWAMVPVSAQEDSGPLVVELVARLAGGGAASAKLGSIEVRERVRPIDVQVPSGAMGPETIAICMATYNPDPDLFAIQIDSIRNQTCEDWICLIGDDDSTQEGLALIERTVAFDPRFIVFRATENLGFYRNFERMLELVPGNVAYVALSDQDDRWFPEKLQRLRDAIGDAQLVYSDLRLVDPDGSLVARTLWSERRTNHKNLASLMIANTVTGAAALFRRELLELALPFPDGPAGWKFHDHWLAGVALASGKVTFVDEPLYDYVQHRGAILKGRISGDAEASVGVLGAPLRTGRRRLRGLLGSGKAPYFFAYRVLAFQAYALMIRCGPALTRRKRRALRLLADAERSWLAFVWLVMRVLRGPVGLDETLGTERVLARGILWRWAFTLRVQLLRRQNETAYDASMPQFDPKDFETVRPRWWPRWRGGA